MAVSLDQLLYGIRQVESGGNYSVVNSIGAVGAYQVMKGNIPSWTKQALGYSMTWQQFRDSRSAQDAVARYMVGKYYKKYGAEGAASMWFSGQPNPNSKASDGGNTVRQYVNKVMSASGGGSVSATSTNVVSSNSGSGVTMTRGETAESYGFVEGLLESNPELKKKFDEAVKNTWSADRFQAAIRDTKWWKTHSQQERDYLVKSFGDPATAKQEYNTALLHVKQFAASLGLQSNGATDSRVKAWAYNVAAKGWSDEQLRYDMGKFLYFSNDNHNGEGGEDLDKLKSYAYSMGVNMATSWFTNGARAMVRGTTTQESLQSQIRKQAKALFPTWSKQIDAGQTVEDLANPYLSTMSQILELPSGSINLFDPTIKKALTYKDPTTGTSAVKPLWQFENDLRSDPRWKKTQNSQDSMMQVAHKVLSDFGLKT